jgi:hypothetical protein
VDAVNDGMTVGMRAAVIAESIGPLCGVMLRIGSDMLDVHKVRHSYMQFLKQRMIVCTDGDYVMWEYNRSGHSFRYHKSAGGFPEVLWPYIVNRKGEYEL